MSSVHLPEVVCWAGPERATLAADLLDAMAGLVSPIGFGGTRSSEVADAAGRLNLTAQDDLRTLLVERPPSCLLLTDAESVDPSALRLAAEQSIEVLCLDPIADGLSELKRRLGASSGTAALRCHLLPSLAESASMTGAEAVLASVPLPRVIRGVSRGPESSRDLFTRLYDLWSAVLRLVDLPETISAQLAHGTVAMPDAPRRVSGQIVAHGRIAGGSAVLLHVGSALESVELRRLEVLSPKSELAITDTGFRLIGPAGDEPDALLEGSDAANDPPTGFLDQCVDQWRRLLDRPISAREIPDANRQIHALACCLACLLSARTGQSESPHLVLQMGR